jgi:Leucine-rich repeat (LRR) protein
MENYFFKGNFNFEGFYITDIKGLKNLSNLKILGLSNNEISDLNGLENLVNLSELYIRNNPIQNYDLCSSLKSLERVSK